MDRVDELRIALDDAAGAVDVGDPRRELDRTRHRFRRRQRRRRGAGVAAVGVVVLVGIGALLVAVGGGDDDVIVGGTDAAGPDVLADVSPEPTTAAPATIPTPEEPAATTAAPTEPSPPPPDSTEPVPTASAEIIDGDPVATAPGWRVTEVGGVLDGANASWIAAYGSGFLVGGVTIEGAAWDDVLAAPPDVSPEIEAIVREQPWRAILFTSDGTAWELVDQVAPDEIGLVWYAVGVGERLVLAAQLDGRSPFEAGDFPVLVAELDGLDGAWTVTSVPFSDEFDELPDTVAVHAGAERMIVDDAGWTVRTVASLRLVFEEFLPEDLAAEARQASGIEYQADGIRLRIGQPLDAGGQETVFLSWEELGLESGELLSFGVRPSTWTAAFGGDEPEPVGDDADPLTADELQAASPTPERWLNELFDTGDGYIVSASGPDGPTIYEVDATADTWVPIEIPGLPTGRAMAAVSGIDDRVMVLIDGRAPGGTELDEGQAAFWFVIRLDDGWIVEEIPENGIGPVAGSVNEDRVLATIDGDWRLYHRI